MVLRSFSGHAACLQVCHLIIPSALCTLSFQAYLIFVVALLCGVVIILYDSTCAIIARGFCYVRCTYFVHVVFVFVPLCFKFCMPCCEYCWSLASHLYVASGDA